LHFHILFMKLICLIIFCNLQFLFIQHFDILYVGSQKWGGGISTAGSGKNYKFTLKVNDSSKNLIIQNVKIGANCYPTNVYSKINSVKGEFDKNDTIYFQVNIRTINKNDTCTEFFPEKFSNQKIVLKYQYKKKIYYRIIDNVREEKPLLYP